MSRRRRVHRPLLVVGTFLETASQPLTYPFTELETDATVEEHLPLDPASYNTKDGLTAHPASDVENADVIER